MKLMHQVVGGRSVNPGSSKQMCELEFFHLDTTFQSNTNFTLHKASSKHSTDISSLYKVNIANIRNVMVMGWTL